MRGVGSSCSAYAAPKHTLLLIAILASAQGGCKMRGVASSCSACAALPQLALRGAGDAGADYAEPELTREELEKELDKLRWGLGSEDWHARVCRAFFSGRALPRPERAWMPCCGHRTAGTLTGLAFLSLQRGNAKHPARAVLPRHRQRAGWYPA